MSQEEMKLLTLIQFEFNVLPTGTSVNGGEINSASKQTKKKWKKKLWKSFIKFGHPDKCVGPDSGGQKKKMFFLLESCCGLLVLSEFSCCVGV